jgi:hypothetical protein
MMIRWNVMVGNVIDIMRNGRWTRRTKVIIKDYRTFRGFCFAWRHRGRGPSLSQTFLMTRGSRIVDKDTLLSFGSTLETWLFQVTFDLGYCASLT